MVQVGMWLSVSGEIRGWGGQEVETCGAVGSLGKPHLLGADLAGQPAFAPCPVWRSMQGALPKSTCPSKCSHRHQKLWPI